MQLTGAAKILFFSKYRLFYRNEKVERKNRTKNRFNINAIKLKNRHSSLSDRYHFLGKVKTIPPDIEDVKNLINIFGLKINLRLAAIVSHIRLYLFVFSGT